MTLTSTLLKTWRDTFDPSVGTLLETWATSQARPLEVLPLKKKERADELARLARHVGDEDRSPVLFAFEAFARDASGALVWPAVEAWAEVEPDPRVARMALRMLVTLEQQLTAKLWRRLVGCLERHGDRGVAKEAAPYLAMLQVRGVNWGFSVERLTNVLQKLERTRVGTPLPAEQLDALAAQVTEVRPAPLDDTAQEATFIKAILDAPDDDAPRAVYADWLTERGSPRGEFINLQLPRGKRSAEQRQRVQQLLASHRQALLGPFDGVVAGTGFKFERGFLVEATASTPLPATPLTRLLRAVTFKRGVGTNVNLDGLERVKCAQTIIEEVRSAAPKLKHLEIAVHNVRVLEALSQPWVESLTLRLGHYALNTSAGEYLRRALATPAAASLRAFHLAVHGMPTFERVVLPSTLETFTFEVATLCTLDLSRNGPAWALEVRAKPEHSQRSKDVAARLVDALGVSVQMTN